MRVPLWTGGMGWLVRGARQRCNAVPGGYKTEIEDGSDGASVGSDFLSCFCFFS